MGGQTVVSMRRVAERLAEIAGDRERPGSSCRAKS
jgi:hypothetical protein